MKTIKKISALIMVLAMALALSVPAMAYRIEITNADQYVEHEYEAYRIFMGDLHTDGVTGADILSNIEWAEGVDGVNALTALKAGIPEMAEAASAQDVADILSKNNTNTTLINTFRHIVGDYLIETAAITPDSGYVWNDVPAGYYLIKDKDGSLENEPDTYTNYILQVVGDTKVIAKDGGVTVDKEINDGGHIAEAADYSIGDTVSFVLTGTLPRNYGDFEDYEYHFVDTLSAGLSFNDDVKVYLENAGTELELEDTWYTVNVGAAASVPGATFTVDFDDLKAITGRTIDQHTSIIVEYTATLNAEAEIGEPGNENEVYIIFDNDPHSDGKGETPPDKVFPFTWELDVIKIDGGTAATLEGAEFILYRELSGAKQYVKVDAADKVAGWTENEAEASTLTSGADGKFIIKGLEADIYYLKETKAPTGYNLLENPIKVDIEASVKESADGTEGVVEMLQIKVDSLPAVDGDKESGIVAMNAVNNPGATLPETGGIGTTLFYIFGGLMVAGAVVLLVTKKRMACEE